MASNNIALDALTLNGTPVPLSGELGGVRAEVTFDAPVQVTQGMAQNVYNQVANPGGTLVITALKEDAAFGVMWGIHNAARAAGGLTTISGTFRLFSSGRTLSFSRGAITQLANLRSEESSSAVSFTVAFDGYEVL